MLECIFTIDYEIYGNGEGFLRGLVFEPAKRLKAIFDRVGAKFVVFVEVAELEKMDVFRTDPAIGDVKRQIRGFYEDGFEIALHLHPQWCDARYEDGKWNLNYSEYNLCTLSEKRIAEILDRSIAYLRKILAVPDFTPMSFRAGNWLFQPTATVAQVLTHRGVKIDSSVFKGGRQHQHNLDYRRALKHGYYWMFKNDVICPDPTGPLLELPIYTRMVPFWKMATTKRLGLQRKGTAGARAPRSRLMRLLDLLRLQQPLKFDFCRMTLNELVSLVDQAVAEDLKSPELFRPIVAIGHTKDLLDLRTVEMFLTYLKRNNIPIRTLEHSYSECRTRCHRPVPLTTPLTSSESSWQA